MIVYLTAYPRIWRDGPTLQHLNWQAGKTSWFDHVFVHHCAMFVLKGKGRVRIGPQEVEVRAPFVLLAHPGRRYAYGPDDAWDEYGFVFEYEPDPSILADFPPAPWPVRAPDMLQEHLALAERLLRDPAVPGVADQLDLLARVMLTCSLHGTATDVPEGPLRRLYAAEAYLRTHFRQPMNVRKVIDRFGFSEATFRRLWNQHFSHSPWQHVLDLRFQEARRLLRDVPDLSVGQIASRCGFRDQRYFGTAFKRKNGQTPTAFRAGLSRQ
jgi:AraC-like DNA-binding protein